MLKAPRSRAHAEAIRQFGQAAREGRTDEMERLLREVKELKIDDSNTFFSPSALSEALNVERVIAIRWLIQHGASVDSTQMYDAYKKYLSQRTSDRESILRLLHKGRASVGSTYEPFHDPAVMIQAVQDTNDERGSYEVLEHLIEQGADVNAVDNETQQSPLIQALTSRREEMVPLLLEAGARVDTRVLVNQHDILAGETALMVAAAYSLNASVRLLLKHDASVTDVSPNNWTALMYAVASAEHYELDGEVVHLLVNAKSPIDAQTSSGETALMMAALYEGNEIDEYSRYYANGDTVQFLLDSGASVDCVDSNSLTALMYAASKGTASIMTRLVDADSPINARSKDGTTVLSFLAGSDHNLSMMELLLNRGAFVDLADNQGWTPLLIAASAGQEGAVRLLLSREASVHATNSKQQTALMLAASAGNAKVIQALLSAGASIEAKDKSEETALMYAVDRNHQDVVRELLSADSSLSQTISLMKLGLEKKRFDAAGQKKADEEAKAEVKLDDLVQLCSKMQEAHTISERICSRLLDVGNHLLTLNGIVVQEATLRFKNLLNKAHGLMKKYDVKHTIIRLVSSRVIISTSRDLNRELDAFLLQFNIRSEVSEVHDWQTQWENDSVAMQSLLKDSLKKTDELMSELQDPQVQKEAVTLLLFECNNHATEYSDEEMKLIQKIFKDISSMSQLKIDSVPEWFVPPHEVEINGVIATGSYGAVHRGALKGTIVAVKLLFLKEENSREMFLNEAQIWSVLDHPHIVHLYQACHVGNPFFVCELGSNGTLSDYLFRVENRFKTWAKLHEAAMGLEYLHTKKKVVHGDLKCDNVVISGEGSAKLTDFGLSFVLGNEQDEHPSSLQCMGAIAWKAPEVIDAKTRGTFASDVYSFGMCIIEAVTGQNPWGFMPDPTVKHKVLKQKQLPKQPGEMNQKQWSLVEQMCEWEPKKRINMSKTVEILQDLVYDELNLEFSARQPTSEPEPVASTGCSVSH